MGYVDAKTWKDIIYTGTLNRHSAHFPIKIVEFSKDSQCPNWS